MSGKVLAFGSGRVSYPCIQYLLRKGHEVVLVDISEENARKTLAGHPNGKIVVADASTEAENLIREHRPGVVVCILPKTFTVSVARACVAQSVSMIGASYVPEEISALDAEAKSRDIAILCEVGLDPGIDHMSAVPTIREVKARGGQVEGFWSVCGALPDIASNTNPMGYKLSWAPASLIGASLRSAKIMVDGNVVDLPDGTTYQNSFFHEIKGLGWFEVYANANSLPYLEAYGIPEARNIYRGTLRYPGWCDMITQMQKLRLFDTTERSFAGATYASLIREITGCADAATPAIECAARFLKLTTHAFAIQKLEWLGFFDEVAVPFARGSLFDVVSALYDQKLQFSPDEKDLIVMQHRFDVTYPGAGRKTHVSTLVSRGDVCGETAIARTTGLPVGIAAHLILTGQVTGRGVLIPTTPDIYEPSLKELANEGLTFTEETIDR